MESDAFLHLNTVKCLNLGVKEKLKTDLRSIVCKRKHLDTWNHLAMDAWKSSQFLERNHIVKGATSIWSHCPSSSKSQNRAIKKQIKSSVFPSRITASSNGHAQNQKNSLYVFTREFVHIKVCPWWTEDVIWNAGARIREPNLVLLKPSKYS